MAAAVAMALGANDVVGSEDVADTEIGHHGHRSSLFGRTDSFNNKRVSRASIFQQRPQFFRRTSSKTEESMPGMRRSSSRKWSLLDGPMLGRTTSQRSFLLSLFAGREDQHAVSRMQDGGNPPNARAEELNRQITKIKEAEAFPPYVVDPNGDKKTIWDAILVLAVLYTSIAVPLAQAFPNAHAFQQDWLQIIDTLIDILFVCDIIVTLRTAVIDRFGEVHTSQKEIWIYYLQGWFYIDLMGAIPAALLALIFQSTAPKMAVVSLGKIPRLVRINKVMRVLDRWHLQNLWRLLQYFLIMILLAHWIACGWVCIVRYDGSINAEFHSDGTTNWDDDTELYFMALYKSFLLLVGSDVQPDTRVQRLYCSAVLICGACFYATIVGNMALLIANFNMTQTRQRQKMEMVSETLRAFQLPKNISQRVQNYYQYTTTHNRDWEGIKLLKELPSMMYNDISRHLYLNTLMKVPLFHGCADSFIGELIIRLRPQVALENEIVVRMGDIGKEMFFISKGSVAIEDSSGKMVAVLSDSSFFGEIALLACVKRTATVRTITTCELNTLSRSDLVAVLQDFPDEVEKFQTAAAERADMIIKSGGNTADLKALTAFTEKHGGRWDSVRSKLKTLVKNPGKLRGALAAAAERQERDQTIARLSEESGRRGSTPSPSPSSAFTNEQDRTSSSSSRSSSPKPRKVERKPSLSNVQEEEPQNDVKRRQENGKKRTLYDRLSDIQNKVSNSMPSSRRGSADVSKQVEAISQLPGAVKGSDSPIPSERSPHEDPTLILPTPNKSSPEWHPTTTSAKTPPSRMSLPSGAGFLSLNHDSKKMSDMENKLDRLENCMLTMQKQITSIQSSVNLIQQGILGPYPNMAVAYGHTDLPIPPHTSEHGSPSSYNMTQNDINDQDNDDIAKCAEDFIREGN